MKIHNPFARTDRAALARAAALDEEAELAWVGAGGGVAAAATPAELAAQQYAADLSEAHAINSRLAHQLIEAREAAGSWARREPLGATESPDPAVFASLQASNQRLRAALRGRDDEIRRLTLLVPDTGGDPQDGEMCPQDRLSREVRASGLAWGPKLVMLYLVSYGGSGATRPLRVPTLGLKGMAYLSLETGYPASEIEGHLRILQDEEWVLL